MIAPTNMTIAKMILIRFSRIQILSTAPMNPLVFNSVPQMVALPPYICASLAQLLIFGNDQKTKIRPSFNLPVFEMSAAYNDARLSIMNEPINKKTPSVIVNEIRYERGQLHPEQRVFIESTVADVVSSRLPAGYNGTPIISDTVAFHEEFPQLIWRDPDILYDRIMNDARNVIPRSSDVKRLVNTYYSTAIVSNLNNIHQYSPRFFYDNFIIVNDNGSTSVNNALFETYQTYIYLLCFIHYLDEHRDDVEVREIAHINEMLNWIATRRDSSIGYIISGPVKNADLSKLNFREHYTTLISPANDMSQMIGYNQLSTSQVISTDLFTLLRFLQTAPNVYMKAPDDARKYNITIDSQKDVIVSIDSNRNLLFNCAAVNLGDTTEQSMVAKYDNLDSVITNNVVNSMINTKKLAEIFRNYSRIRILELVFTTDTFVTSLDAFNKVFVVFRGVSCSERNVYNTIPTNFLKIGGKFEKTARGYEFRQDVDVVTYKSNLADVKSFDVYVTTDPSYDNQIIPNEYAIEFRRESVYQHPIATTLVYNDVVMRSAKLFELMRMVTHDVGVKGKWGSGDGWETDAKERLMWSERMGERVGTLGELDTVTGEVGKVGNEMVMRYEGNKMVEVMASAVWTLMTSWRNEMEKYDGVSDGEVERVRRMATRSMSSHSSAPSTSSFMPSHSSAPSTHHIDDIITITSRDDPSAASIDRYEALSLFPSASIASALLPLLYKHVPKWMTATIIRSTSYIADMLTSVATDLNDPTFTSHVTAFLSTSPLTVASISTAFNTLTDDLITLISSVPLTPVTPSPLTPTSSDIIPIVPTFALATLIDSASRLATISSIYDRMYGSLYTLVVEARDQTNLTYNPYHQYRNVVVDAVNGTINDRYFRIDSRGNITFEDADGKPYDIPDQDFLVYGENDNDLCLINLYNLHNRDMINIINGSFMYSERLQTIQNLSETMTNENVARNVLRFDNVYNVIYTTVDGDHLVRVHPSIDDGVSSEDDTTWEDVMRYVSGESNVIGRSVVDRNVKGNVSGQYGDGMVRKAAVRRLGGRKGSVARETGNGTRKETMGMDRKRADVKMKQDLKMKTDVDDVMSIIMRGDDGGDIPHVTATADAVDDIPHVTFTAPVDTSFDFPLTPLRSLSDDLYTYTRSDVTSSPQLNGTILPGPSLQYSVFSRTSSLTSHTESTTDSTSPLARLVNANINLSHPLTTTLTSDSASTTRTTIYTSTTTKDVNVYYKYHDIYEHVYYTSDTWTYDVLAPTFTTYTSPLKLTDVVISFALPLPSSFQPNEKGSYLEGISINIAIGGVTNYTDVLSDYYCVDSTYRVFIGRITDPDTGKSFSFMATGTQSLTDNTQQQSIIWSTNGDITFTAYVTEVADITSITITDQFNNNVTIQYEDGSPSITFTHPIISSIFDINTIEGVSTAITSTNGDITTIRYSYRESPSIDSSSTTLKHHHIFISNEYFTAIDNWTRYDVTIFNVDSGKLIRYSYRGYGVAKFDERVDMYMYPFDKSLNRSVVINTFDMSKIISYKTEMNVDKSNCYKAFNVTSFDIKRQYWNRHMYISSILACSLPMTFDYEEFPESLEQISYNSVEQGINIYRYINDVMTPITGHYIITRNRIGEYVGGIVSQSDISSLYVNNVVFKTYSSSAATNVTSSSDGNPVNSADIFLYGSDGTAMFKIVITVNGFKVRGFKLFQRSLAGSYATRVKGTRGVTTQRSSVDETVRMVERDNTETMPLAEDGYEPIGEYTYDVLTDMPTYFNQYRINITYDTTATSTGSYQFHITNVNVVYVEYESYEYKVTNGMVYRRKIINVKYSNVPGEYAQATDVFMLRIPDTTRYRLHPIVKYKLNIVVSPKYVDTNGNMITLVEKYNQNIITCPVYMRSQYRLVDVGELSIGKRINPTDKHIMESINSGYLLFGNMMKTGTLDDVSITSDNVYAIPMSGRMIMSLEFS